MPTKYFPAYLFLGEEDFLKEEAVKKLAAEFLNKGLKELNYRVFYAKDKDFSIREMLECLNTQPFISDKQLVVLKDADSLAASAKESVLLYLNKPNISAIFIIESASPAIKGGFLLEASKKAHLVYYRKPADSAINAWLAKKAWSAGKKIKPEAIKAMRESLPDDLRVLSSSIENIILYALKKPLITKEDVEKVIGVSAVHTAFDLIEAIERKDAAFALKVFSRLKKDRKKEIELLGLLGWSARMLLRAKEFSAIRQDKDTRQALGLNPRMLDQMMQHAAGFKKSEILLLLDEILSSDVAIKTGSSPGYEMERLIVKVCL